MLVDFQHTTRRYSPKDLWEAPTLKQTLAKQHGPLQFQGPLGRAPLVTKY
jgi:hypothetical protein